MPARNARDGSVFSTFFYLFIYLFFFIRFVRLFCKLVSDRDGDEEGSDFLRKLRKKKHRSTSERVYDKLLTTALVMLPGRFWFLSARARANRLSEFGTYFGVHPAFPRGVHRRKHAPVRLCTYACEREIFVGRKECGKTDRSSRRAAT
jgi:hypothetical protein